MSEINRNVFINCPFDAEYRLCFEALVFAISACGYKVRCALEDDDGAAIRFDKLLRLIRESQRTVHDLSRVELSSNALPRFNMPFELGLAIGAKRFGTKEQKKKTALVMVRAPFALPAYLSDMSGGDQQSHGNDAKEVIRIVSSYLHETPDGKHVPGPAWLANSFSIFRNDALPQLAAAANRSLAESDAIKYYRVYLAFVSAFLSEAKAADA